MRRFVPGPSERQRRILAHLTKNGWLVHKKATCIQLEERGYERMKLTASTFDALRDHGWIVPVVSTPDQYTLTPAGRRIVRPIDLAVAGGI